MEDDLFVLVVYDDLPVPGDRGANILLVSAFGSAEQFHVLLTTFHELRTYRIL